MKFPILIHLLNNRARHIVSCWEDMPTEHYFKILQTGISPEQIDLVIDADYRYVEEPETNEELTDESPQESNELPEPDSSNDGTSDGSEDSGSDSV